MTDPWTPPAYGPPSTPGPYGSLPAYPAYFQGYGAPPPKPPRVVEPEPGTPYHRLARTTAHRWWRPLVGTLMILAFSNIVLVMLIPLFYLIQLITTGDSPAQPKGDEFFANDDLNMAFNLLALAVYLPFVLLGAWWVQRRRPGTVTSVTGRLRRRWLLICTGLAAASCLLSVGLSWAASPWLDDSGLDGSWVGWGRFLVSAAVIVSLVPFQAAAEEYVFRGWLLQGISAHTLEDRPSRTARAVSKVLRTPWPAVVISSVAFTLGHGYTGWGVVDIFLFGAVLCVLAIRTGGLESGIAIHVLNNLMAFLIPATVGELDIVQGDIPLLAVVVDITPLLLYAVVVAWLAGRMGIRRVTPLESDSVALSANEGPYERPAVAD